MDVLGDQKAKYLTPMAEGLLNLEELSKDYDAGVLASREARNHTEVVVASKRYMWMGWNRTGMQCQTSRRVRRIEYKNVSPK